MCELTDGANTVEVAASPLQPLGARGIIYNVPLGISAEDILSCLAIWGNQSIISITAMDMSLAIAEVNYIAQSAAANISTASAALLLWSVPTAAAVTPPITICPSYQRETAKLKLKTVAKLSYADACTAHKTSSNPPVPNITSQSAFPPLPKSTVDRSHARPFIGTTLIPHAPGVPLDQEELIVTLQVDFSSLLFGNPVTFLAFL